MRSIWLLLLVFTLLFYSCNYKPAPPAFWTIGNQDKKFQKVFDYYRNPEDSLKLKAAHFLVSNMKQHFYYNAENESETDVFFQQIDEKISLPPLSNKKLYEVLRRELIDLEIEKAINDGSLSKPKHKKRADIKTLDADFLIENIEYAFKAWEFPWSKKYSFENFCRYILPYRNGNEMPDNWRKIVYEQFKWVADSLKNTHDPMQAASFINNQFYQKLSYVKNSRKNEFRLKVTNQLAANIYGNCHEQATVGVSILRALGIAASPVSIPNWGNLNFGHELTGMLDLQNNWHYFNFGESGPEKDLKFRPPKMYLKQFDNMQHYSPVYTDISGKIMETVALEIETRASKNDDVYLCVFGNLEWLPICKGEHSTSGTRFKNIGLKNHMFLAAVKTSSGLIPVSNPFSTDTLGNVTYYKANHSKLIGAKLERKWAYWGYINRITALIGGEFSVASDKNFSEKQILYKIEDTLEYYNNIKQCAALKGKYFQYHFPQVSDSVFDGPAEVTFYTTRNGSLRKIEGKYFGSPQLSEKQIDLLTDNDILTYVEVWDCEENVDIETGKIVLRKNKEPIWIGMEADTATTVTHVGICPRNDKNGIYEGMHYELFYWENKWISLGKKVATGNSVSFDGIPQNAVLWLRNLDEGKEERIFTLEDGKQIWW